MSDIRAENWTKTENTKIKKHVERIEIFSSVKEKNCSFVSNAISDELQSRSNRGQALIRGRALIRAWAHSRVNTVFIIYTGPFSEQTSSNLKYLMNSCIWHSESSILRLLHYNVTLLIAKILLNYEFELEILILIVLSYCGVSNTPCLGAFLFINSY